MKRLNKLAIGVVAAVASLNANAGTFETTSSEVVTVEAATKTAYKANIAANGVVLKTGSAVAVSDRIFITLDKGATFTDKGYSLIASAGGTSIVVGSLENFTAGDSVLEFKFTSANGAPLGSEFILSGSEIGRTIPAPIGVGLIAQPAKAVVKIDAYNQDGLGSYDAYTAAGLFSYATQFTAAVGTKAAGVIDVNQSRLKFESGLSYEDIVISLTNSAQTNDVTLNGDDKFVVTLSGDLSGLAAIKAFAANATKTEIAAAKTATVNAAKTSAVFSFDADDVALASGAFRLAGATSVPLTPRSFKVGAVLELEDEKLDRTLIDLASKTAPVAGAWTINGLQAKVSQMSLNTTGFISWLKVANTGTTSVDVLADIIYTLADGTEGVVTGAALGTVDAGGVATISEATILTALGAPKQLVDAHLTVTVTGPSDSVHLSAEKKASDGRTTIPVYYDNSTGSDRNWFQ